MIPEIGRDIAWTDIIRHVFHVLEFDRAGTKIGPEDKVKAKSHFKPYGYLHVESPILNLPVRLPIVHSTDFLLADSVFGDSKWSKVIEEEELLVTYVPKKKLPKGMAGVWHALHYVIVPDGTLEEYYSIENDKYMANPQPEKLFGKLVWEGEIQVQVNDNPNF